MTDADGPLAAIQRRSAALVSKDVDALLELLHPSFIYINADGQVLDRDEYLDLYVHAEAVRWLRQDIHEPQIVESGDTVVVTYLVHDVARYEGEELDQTFRSTLTWINRGRTWQCLGGHTSHLPEDLLR